MATLKQATSGLLSSVLSTTSAVSTVVDSVAGSVDLFSNYIDKCKSEQSVRYKIEGADFAKDLIEASSVSRTKKELVLKQFAETSEFHAERLSVNLEYYSNLLK